jgi:hypothetical protein
MSETRTYPVTQPQIETIAAKLKEHGFNLDPHAATGAASAQGFEFVWTRTGTDDPTRGTIAITLNKHPFAMGGLFWNQIDKELRQA